jgi:hypothetical protein
MKLFDAFKQYIVTHPKVAAYKPSSDKYDSEKLLDILKELAPDELDFTEEEKDKVVDFVEISDSFHKMADNFYNKVKSGFDDFNMKGENIVEYLIASLNREYRVVWNKMQEAMYSQPNGTYLFQDMTNTRLQLPDGSMVETRAALEASTDAINLVCNYLRFYLNDDFKNDQANPERFALNVLSLYQMADMFVTFKHTYDDILYNGGFVKIDREKQTLTFDYGSHYNLKLLKVGNMMFGERIMHVNSRYRFEGKTTGFEKYITNTRIKPRVKVQDGRVALEFGQGNPKELRKFYMEMEAAIEAFYEFLDMDVVLRKLSDVRLAEALAVWTALRYVCFMTFVNVNCDVTMFTKEQMGVIPRLFKKEDLIDYIFRLTRIKYGKVKVVVESFEVDWKHFNDIWCSPLYAIGDSYSIPFFPVINSVPYNIIDHLLDRGGCDLDERGKIFEKYLHQRITGVNHRYPVTCFPSKYYGEKPDGEEIDLIVVLKKLVIVAEVKCIHYSMEPQEYYNAWSRLSEGAEQAKRKTEFIVAHPELFGELGEMSGKQLLPIVVTNYPTYTGFEQKGVYVIDSHSFMSYLCSGYMTERVLSATDNPIVDARFFYTNEDEYSTNFEQYLKKNPVKELYMPKIVVEDITQLPSINPWKCRVKSAVYKGNPGFDISNRPRG